MKARNTTYIGRVTALSLLLAAAMLLSSCSMLVNIGLMRRSAGEEPTDTQQSATPQTPPAEQAEISPEPSDSFSLAGRTLLTYSVYEGYFHQTTYDASGRVAQRRYMASDMQFWNRVLQCGYGENGWQSLTYEKTAYDQKRSYAVSLQSRNATEERYLLDTALRGEDLLLVRSLDSQGRVLTEQWLQQDGKELLTRAYRVNGLVDSETCGGVTYRYSYTEDGHIRAIEGEGLSMSALYGANGLPDRVLRAEGEELYSQSMQYGESPWGPVSSILERTAEGIHYVFKEKYTYDAKGNLVEQRTHIVKGEQKEFLRDMLNRYTYDESGSYRIASETVEYDALGERSSRTVYGYEYREGVVYRTSIQQYDGQDTLQSSRVLTYADNAWGDRIWEREESYDASGKLTEASDRKGEYTESGTLLWESESEYPYGKTGALQTKTEYKTDGKSVTQSLYDGWDGTLMQSMRTDYDESGSVCARQSYERTESGSEKQSAVYDAQGRVVRLETELYDPQQVLLSVTAREYKYKTEQDTSPYWIKRYDYDGARVLTGTEEQTGSYNSQGYLSELTVRRCDRDGKQTEKEITSYTYTDSANPASYQIKRFDGQDIMISMRTATIEYGRLDKTERIFDWDGQGAPTGKSVIYYERGLFSTVWNRRTESRYDVNDAFLGKTVIDYTYANGVCVKETVTEYDAAGQVIATEERVPT